MFSVRCLIRKFKKNGSVMNATPHTYQRSVRSDDKVTGVEVSVTKKRRTHNNNGNGERFVFDWHKIQQF